MLKKKIAFVAAITVLVSFNTSVLASATDEISKNNTKISELNKSKETLEKEKSQISQEVLDLTEQISAKQSEIDGVQKNVDLLQIDIDGLQKSINSVTRKIDVTQNNIDQTEKKLEEKESEQILKEEMLGKRIRRSYINNSYNEFIGIVLDSNSISEALFKIKYVSDIIKTDNQIINDIIKIKSQLEESRKKLSVEKKSLSDDRNALVFQQNSIEEKQNLILTEKNRLRTEQDKISSMEKEKQKRISSIDKQQNVLSSQIEDIMEINEKLENQIKDMTGNTGYEADGSISFIRPATGVYTSMYGPRIHPVTGKQGYHTGVDIANGFGTTIKSAESGKVILAQYYGGYGNCIIIDHGNGYSTLYGHLQSFAVSAGQYVSQGQTIGYMGSTGMSTGPHLHFEVRISGQHTNPMNYIK